MMHAGKTLWLQGCLWFELRAVECVLVTAGGYEPMPRPEHDRDVKLWADPSVDTCDTPCRSVRDVYDEMSPAMTTHCILYYWV
ncbi:hypothetical protein GGR50DRAFT_698621 [Xylaria sp. CBS 124048]|nr:hypothetical protein GGR50DRAFT_698621 [Xylaria sp. CBS 124048]